LHDAGRGEWRASEVSPLRACGAFSGNEWEEVLGGNRVVEIGYRHYVEPKVGLLKGFPEGAVFRAPLNQEFFYPSRATVMSDASRFVASQYLLYGRFVPGGIATPKGFDGSRPYLFGAGMSARGLCFSLGGELQ
jgi:hypothetical protein